MRSQRATRILQQGIWREAEAGRGLGRSLLQFSGSRVAEMQYDSLFALPCVENTTVLQDTGSGDFIFLTGYSALDGPDVML